MNEIKIYILNKETLAGMEEQIVKVIAPHYLEKYQKAKAASVKSDELGAGLLLSKILGVTRDEELKFGEYKKPMMKDDSKCFSLSHSVDYVVLAVSDFPVGIDIERTDRLSLSVLKRVLPSSCYEKLPQNEEDTNTKLEWTKSWTTVEAILKADGSGFMVDPRDNEDFMEGWYHESILHDKCYMISCASKEPFILHVHNVTMHDFSI